MRVYRRLAVNKETMMVRFIFICMAVVAVAILTTTAQFMIDGIDQAQDTVSARNTAPSVEQASTPSQDVAAITSEENLTPEALNDIQTAAGDEPFTGGFSGQAPKGLEDDAPVLMPVPLNTLDSAAQ